MAKKKQSTAVVVAKGQAVHVIANPHATRDAIVFLRKAKSELMSGIRAGRINDLDTAHLMSLLALQALSGGGQ